MILKAVAQVLSRLQGLLQSKKCKYWKMEAHCAMKQNAQYTISYTQITLNFSLWNKGCWWRCVEEMERALLKLLLFTPCVVTLWTFLTSECLLSHLESNFIWWHKNKGKEFMQDAENAVAHIKLQRQ